MSADTAEKAWWRKLRPDTFLMLVMATGVLATLFPVTGVGVSIISWTQKVAVAVLFFLYGVRIDRESAIAGLKHWRLHILILGFTYLVFPLVSLGMVVFKGHIDPDLYRGLLWVAIVPGTVQSAINFTAIAKGNVAGAVVSSSISNLLGVFFTPLLAMALMSTTGLHISATSIIDIAAQVLAPFILGQLLRPWCADFVIRHKKLKYFDQLTICLMVYIAFSAGVREGIWTRTSVPAVLLLVGICIALLSGMYALTWFVSGKLGFNRPDQIAIQFCGTKKSLTTGVPMASVLFPAASVGFIVLPLMIYHQLQITASSILASRYAAKPDSWFSAADTTTETTETADATATTDTTTTQKP
ncbi:MAG: bile acid:sodium symporter [Propionibacteriaceae bacterium]|jgi:sodium/bile acid cotransporter 7|nr:bile acid:sodium symporter [Propionibacteriaceae bacterium]